MFRFNDGGSIDVTIPAGYEPPRPDQQPFARRDSLVRTMGTDGSSGETIVDVGLDTARTVRFVSGETQGFITPAEMAALRSLYEAGAAFTLVTDLLGAVGDAAKSYPARFLPGVAPQFTPAVPDGSLFYLDLSLRLGAAA